MNAEKLAKPDHPILELLAQRWSPYSFADRTVSKADLQSLFEAARWAPSSYNEQPWSYIVATREEPGEFERVLSCLVEGNQVWAKAAPVLAIGCTNLQFARNGKSNAAAVHDLGLASGGICCEATARGLAMHQMIGIQPDRVRELFGVPQHVQPLTALAIGYAGDPAALPEALRPRDLGRRQRKPLAQFVFSRQWGTASRLTQ
jgi:nitroreductase